MALFSAWRKSNTRFLLFILCLFNFQVWGHHLRLATADSHKMNQQQMEDPFWDVTVQPHWLRGGEAFWYRRSSGPSTYEFIFVDIPKGIRRAAFDHEKLAELLGHETGEQFNSSSLPFSWIHLSQDGSIVQFRAKNKRWEFHQDGKLETSKDQKLDLSTDENLVQWSTQNMERLKNIKRGIPSTSGGDWTYVTFINQTDTPLSLFWVDEDGKDINYKTVEVEQPSKRATYVGHVWRLVEPSSGKTVAVYRATENHGVAIIEDSFIDEAIVDSDSILPKGELPNINESEETLESQQSARYTVFVRDYNVWVRDADGKETKMSSNGSKQHPYSMRVYLSPEGNHAVAWQYTPAQEHPITLVESSPKDQVQPKSKIIDYPKPGDRVRVDRPRMFNLETKLEIPTDDTLFENPYSVENIGWNTDGSEYRFLFNERGHQNLRIIGMSGEGKVRALVEENSKTFIDYSGKTYWRDIKGSNELLWASERDGYNHLYLYDMESGTVKNQITKGEWMMRAVVWVDEPSRRIWFRAFGIVPGQDPYYAHLARINFNGTGLTVLTEGDGTHTWKWTPGQKYFTDTWSRVDSPSQTVVRDAETGKIITGVETVEKRRLDQDLAQYPERFSAPGRDGKTMIYGIIVKPTDFDPMKKYPVIESIYAGPQDFFVPKSFSSPNRQKRLADLGFIVVQIDGMGTNWRGKAFHDVCYKNLKDGGFPDRIAWMKAAAETRSYMDISKVGVFGGSAGGQNAMAALLFHGDFYKAAIADSGCHDNRMDKLWWNEQWMGYPVDKSYEDSSNVVHAKKLTGALMLMLGELDTNVDPSSTFQVVNALNKASKDYDFIFVPGGGHGAGSAFVRRQHDFFQKHLQGIDHPNRNKG